MSEDKIDEKSIFNHARMIGDPAKREDYLQQACFNNSDAIKRIRDLLKVHEEERTFLHSPALELEPKELQQTIAAPLKSEKSGDYIGPYAVRSIDETKGGSQTRYPQRH